MGIGVQRGKQPLPRCLVARAEYGLLRPCWHRIYYTKSKCLRCGKCSPLMVTGFGHSISCKHLSSGHPKTSCKWEKACHNVISASWFKNHVFATSVRQNTTISSFVQQSNRLCRLTLVQKSTHSSMSSSPMLEKVLGSRCWEDMYPKNGWDGIPVAACVAPQKMTIASRTETVVTIVVRVCRQVVGCVITDDEMCVGN